MWAAIHYCILFESGHIIATDCDFYVCAFFMHKTQIKKRIKEIAQAEVSDNIYIFFPIKTLKPNK